MQGVIPNPLVLAKLLLEMENISMTERKARPANLSKDEKRIFKEAQDAAARGDAEALAELAKPGDASLVEVYVRDPQAAQGDPEFSVSLSHVPENIDEYAGMWVALRNGEVVAAAESYDELERSEGFEPTDAFYTVPETGTQAYET